MLLLLAACGAPPGPPPVTDLSTLACATSPDLISALPLPLDKDKPVKIDLGATPACLAYADGSRASYVALNLPVAPGLYLVTVSSKLVGNVLFAPRVSLLGSTGAVIRQVPQDDFNFHGDLLSVGLRVTPDIRFILVTSEPASVGQGNSHVVTVINSSTSTTYVGKRPVVTTYTGGTERTDDFVYTHNGTVIVRAEPMPTGN